MVTTNTFGSNARKLAGRATVAEAYRAAAECARTAGARYVAGDIGPTGALLEPWGALSFEEATPCSPSRCGRPPMRGAT